MVGFARKSRRLQEVSDVPLSCNAVTEIRGDGKGDGGRKVKGPLLVRLRMSPSYAVADVTWRTRVGE